LVEMTEMTAATFDTRRAVPLAVIEREFRIPASTLRRWCRNGTLRAYRRRTQRGWRVLPEDVVDLLEFRPSRDQEAR
jgi:predicted site-specific integrase-resolvase